MAWIEPGLSTGACLHQADRRPPDAAPRRYKEGYDVEVLVSLFCLLLLLSLPMAAQAATVIADVRVVDGDTLSFEGLGVTVRLDGIDAPESRQACESAEGERYECGSAATQALKEKIAGKPVRCEGDQRDRYGRLSAVCFTSRGTECRGCLQDYSEGIRPWR